ncbi:flavodoxin family protein [Halolactibacillus sp. JCM 19043]|uniref:flavodoxin family protein n=1 Tax=Halolactibacillus sp. JCM 19043 TaxID=1460638 RepID=UPI00078414B9|nr:flavodoxin family protein [Halolactibacillus sp. JCM 19043]
MTDIHVLFLNASLKDSSEPSHTQGLYERARKLYEQEGAQTESVRLADYDIRHGVTGDEGDGDEWPQLLEKVIQADIVLIGTPLWLGEKSSLATQAIERLYGTSGDTNDKGQAIYYNKVGGVVITGNEDGAKHAAASILYGLSHIGFVIPPNVDAYWVGEAGPGPSYMDGKASENAFTNKHIEMLVYNTLYFAKLLKDHPIPAKGNTL